MFFCLSRENYKKSKIFFQKQKNILLKADKIGKIIPIFSSYILYTPRKFRCNRTYRRHL